MTRSGTYIAMVVLLLAGASAEADVEIQRCLLEDGTIAFQEMPCPEPTSHVDDGSEAGENNSESGTPPADDNAFDFVNPFDEPENPPMPAEPTLRVPASQDRAECEKITRDEIDAIDLEMRGTAYSKEQGEEYLNELLALTQQLRTCKQL